MSGEKARARQGGFTIVELVVVFAIVIVLSAIAFVYTGPAREKGRQQVCVSNLHQLTAALIQYRADWDGNEFGDSATDCGFPRTVIELRPYVRSDKTWECPDVSLEQMKKDGWPARDGFWTEYNAGWVFGPEFAPGTPTVGSVLRRRGDMFVTWFDTYHDFPLPDRPHVSGVEVVARLDGSSRVRVENMGVPSTEW